MSVASWLSLFLLVTGTDYEFSTGGIVNALCSDGTRKPYRNQFLDEICDFLRDSTAHRPVLGALHPVIVNAPAPAPPSTHYRSDIQLRVAQNPP